MTGTLLPPARVKYLYERIFHARKIKVAVINSKAARIHCPFHKDPNPSLSISWEKNGVFHCFGCGAKGNLFSFAKRLGYQITPDGNLQETTTTVTVQDPEPTPQATQQPQETNSNGKYTIEDYAEEKKLDPEILRGTFHLHEKEKAVVIPYLNKLNNVAFCKYREAGKKFYYDKGADLIPYGIWLPYETDTLFIVEGESDVHTLVENGVAALGIPGANTWKGEWCEYLIPFKNVFVVEEQDAGGKEFVKRIKETLTGRWRVLEDRINVIRMELVGIKDINALWQEVLDLTDGNRDKAYGEFERQLNILKSYAPSITVEYERIVRKAKLLDDINSRVSSSILRRYVVYLDPERDVFYEWDKNLRILVERNFKNWSGAVLQQENINVPHRVSAIRSELKNALSKLYYEGSAPELPPADWVHFANISVNYKTLQTKQFDHRWFITKRIAVNYNPEAKSEILQKAVSDWVDDPVWIYELIGYIFLPDYKGKKIFFLFGRGDNGKTTLANIVKRMLNGERDTYRNWESASLREIMENHFILSNIVNKMVNWGDDIGYDTITDSSRLKTLSGGGTINVEAKFRRPYSTHNTAKLVFSTNKIPATTDGSEAFRGRMVIVKFRNLPKSVIDKNFLEKVTQEDIEWLAYRSMLALNQLYKNNFVFSVEKKYNMATLYERMSNPLVEFIDTYLVKDELGEIGCRAFYDKFIGWCKRVGQPTMNYKQVLSYMKDLGYENYRRTTGDRRMVFSGLTWKQWGDEEASTEDVPF